MPFEVLLDEDGAAAEVVGTNRLGPSALVKPGQWSAGVRSLAGGHIQHRTGRRPLQLGATLVLGPGDELHHADFEDYAGDHADLDAVIGAIPD